MQFQNEYNKTDLVYDPFCLRLFAQLEAVKREKFPPETMRQWFIEFTRRGWNKNMVQLRYDALMGTKIYGIEKLEIADWINAVQVYAIDEVNVMIKNKIESMISNGRYLKDKKAECILTDEEKRNISIYESDLIKRKFYREQLEANEEWIKQERIRIKKELILKDKQLK